MAATNFVASIATVVAFILTAIANALISSGIGVKYTNTDIADSHPTYLLPSGYAFSIWGIIYLFVGLFCVYQAMPSARSTPEIVTVRPLMLGALFTNVLWLILFSYAVYWAAWIVILMYAAVLLRAVQVLDMHWLSNSKDWKSKVLVALPFSLNASWVCVASCLQVGVNSLEEGWVASDDFCIGLLLLAVLIACYRCATNVDIGYGFVGAWALGGIIANQSAESTFGCASRICNDACIDSMALCSSTGRFGALCSAYMSTKQEDCSGLAKSDKMTTACWIFIGMVISSLLLGMARALVARHNHPAADVEKDANGLIEARTLTGSSNA